MKTKRIFISLCISLLLISCEKHLEVSTEPITVHEEDDDYNWSQSDAIPIVLNGTTIECNSNKVSISGTKATIKSAGQYLISGTLANGQIVVNTNDEATVKLIFNGANVSNSNNSPVYVCNSKKTILIITENTENVITDGSTYIFANGEDEPNATIYSKADLTIYGDGKLTVNGNYNDGITSKDGLIIKNANISVTTNDDGIRGKDYLITDASTLNINAGGDGIKSDNDENSTAGFINIESGTFNITAKGDGIYAINDIIVTDGIFNIKTGGGSNYTTLTSAKGLKAGNSLLINCETLLVNSADDALHSNNNLEFNYGDAIINAADDGIHADNAATINNGTITISKSYEGFESALITVNSGNIHIIASDDGINGAGGAVISTQYGNVASGNMFINGGYIYVNATGDGVDINGNITMIDGKLIVHGPTNNGNGAIDYDGTFKLTGGYLVAVGSSGMAQAPSTSSTQYSVLVNLTSSQQATTPISIINTDGNQVLSFKSDKTYQSLIFSSPEITSGQSYNVYLGGSCSGALTDGIYEGGTYTAGTKYTTFTVSSTVTKIGNTGGHP